MDMNVPMSLPPVTRDLAEARRHVAQTGVAIVADVLTADEVREARERLAEQGEAERERGLPNKDRAAEPRKTPVVANQRVDNLVNKGEIFRRILMNPVGLDLIRHVLGKDFLLSAMFANTLHRCDTPQPMHTDQAYVGPLPQVMTSSHVWALCDFSRENGSTLVVPGSHLWNALPSVDTIKSLQPLAVEAPAGSVVLLDGRVWHQGGANRTDRPRPALTSYFCRPYMRQKENFALSLAPEVLAQCSPELRALLGFRTWWTLGSIDGDEHVKLDRRPTTYSRELRPQRLERV